MDGVVNNGMCRCCASEGTFKDVRTAYHWMGEQEVYSEMLRDCFDVTLAVADEAYEGGVCEVCITQLRNASNFKKQVIQTEEQFRLRLENKLFKSDIIKLEPDKEDDNENEFGMESDHLDSDYSGPEYEVPIKEEPKPKKRAARAGPSRAKKAKTSEGETSERPSQRIRDAENSDSEQIKLKKNLNFSSFIAIKPVASKKRRRSHNLKEQKASSGSNRITELGWQIENAKIVIQCSNATPIRCYMGTRYSCSYCVSQFPDPQSLKQHTIELHIGDKNQRPDFVNIRSLSRYIVYMDITDLQCSLCLESMEKLQDLIDHLKKEHKQPVHDEINMLMISFKFNKPNEYKCAVCGEKFDEFSFLHDHTLTHYKNYFCEFCDDGFVNRSAMIQHKMAVHNVLQKVKASNIHT